MRNLLVPFAALLGLALALTPACRRGDRTAPNPNTPIQPTAEGPAEKSGAAVDEAAEKTEEGAKSAASTAGSAVEKAGDKMKP